ncbi:ANL_HP_G0186940.mRNA.1.CDS.1 [Saccharomyces cerevisiae]|nr:ANL_HP_G0186940.mRNA.1.CDS.1 [Saccharomyces cerevisiae]CAI6391310.1 ANL_HP_G0186940.mRNA.1.CDS.1 [Saccharomyces cerevisiae]
MLEEFYFGYFAVLKHLFQEYCNKHVSHFDLNESVIYNNVLTIFELFVTFKPIAEIFTKIDGFFAD